MGCMKRGVGVNVRGWTENGNAALGLSWDQEWQVETGGARTLWSPIGSMLCHVMCVYMCVCVLTNVKQLQCSSHVQQEICSKRLGDLRVSWIKDVKSGLFIFDV